MRDDQKDARMQQIEGVAYDLLAQVGYGGASMLKVARAAKASNETMYRWYGDKRGLFAAMVRRNASDLRDQLDAGRVAQTAPEDSLRQAAPALLQMVLGDKAILLNRAAACDASGELGQVIAAEGRDQIAPRISALIARLPDARADQVRAQTDLFLSLLIGDRQIRRVIGTLPAPGTEETRAEADLAVTRFLLLLRS
ncbi:hypothetical protein ACMU_10505 [Actibacterium mucosum KCTC 23349]|uniref:HTH tetR-type domain-containing protein n=1 Tax=Actibacterium mucosum KCTC 23349 TaxID=1454373 RepID=A0A037ZKK5_9RHOB|nr:TetR/AcrR family transcriptional regulator [Actibacterium mucosum]KAJ56174.1 hypothetical protein ACMU_10505 [Actibacterium mucosum KCTC 23349]